MSKLYKFLTLAMLLISTSVFAQSYQVYGTITDEISGEALVGANVYFPAINLGAVTDFEGKYTIDQVPGGNHNIRISYIGYETQEQSINVNSRLKLDFALASTSVVLEGLVVEVNKAVERESPITFTEIGKEELQAKYNTQDVPDLLKTVPGVFTNSGGLGESQIFVRGFDFEQVLILINGVPVNDPESQQVYWSNWTGLSSSSSSVQVQRGVGASLVGSGALGGSVNIQTGLFSRVAQLRLKGSAGLYTTEGINGGARDGKSADGTGGYQTSSPSNQNLYLEYTTGQMYDGKLNMKLSYERKAGDSYLNGTYYNGHAYYLGLQSIMGDHLLEFTAHGAPQRHNQARSSQDVNLLDKLGREYNRSNHPYQENYYFKPQFELHWDWNINKNQHINANAFFTTGSGGGRYLRNDNFDVNTGQISFKDVSESTSWTELGRNARWVYDNTGVALTGYDAANNIFTYGGTTDTVTRSGRAIIPSQFGHSWRNDSQNNHVQFGFNGSYSHKLNKYLSVIAGGEVRRWDAEHFAESFDFRVYDPVTGSAKIYDEVQRRYDYDGIVTNFSGFGRLLITPIENLIITADGQYASSKQEIKEKGIEIFDFATGQFTGQKFFATQTNGTFSADEYEQTFSFFTPKFGARFNVTEALSVFGNWGQAKKEPKSGDWYDRSNGPRRNDVKEETITNTEIGIGYRHRYFAIEVNGYMSDFEDKIESVTKQDGNRDVINAGSAKHKGIEFSGTARYQKFDAFASVTVSSNEWEAMNVDKIFGEDAADVVGKKVPFSPQTMYHAGLGFSPTKDLRIGVETSVWQDYYANYTNTAKLPNFFELNASVSYGFELNKTRINLRLDAYNLTNKEQFQRADWGRDFNRNDSQAGKYNMYVLQSRLRTFFLTASITI